MKLFKESPEFVAIGDITTDAFIRLQDATVTKDENGENPKLCIRFGDKVPYEFVEEVRAVGNSSNAAVSAARLGLSSALVADIGEDRNGRECKETLTANKVSTTFITTHKKFKTNYHYVLWHDDDRTILVKHEAFPYKLPNIGAPKWVYISSLAGHSEDYHGQIAEYLVKNPSVKAVFQPGTFQIQLGYEKLKKIYERCEIFFCNIEEAKEILNITNHTEIRDLIQQFRKLGPKIVVLTDGSKGAYVYDGAKILFMPTYPDPKPPVDRTGAGDAFASTFTSALALGKKIEEAIMWAPINSMSVVQEVGAQKGLLSRSALESFLAKAPADYKPKEV